MKRILLILFLIVLSAAPALATTQGFGATCLTGGTSGCLDALDVTTKSLANGDRAFVRTTHHIYEFRFNSTSAATESSPWVIAPDLSGGSAYSEDGRWVLVAMDNFGTGLYDFSVNGGTAANYTLGSIPNNSTVCLAWYEVLTQPTSEGSTTIAFGVVTDDADGILAATAVGNEAFNSGYHDATPDGTATNFTTKTTADRNVVLTIAGDDLTAGKIRLWWQFLISE